MIFPTGRQMFPVIKILADGSAAPVHIAPGGECPVIAVPQCLPHLGGVQQCCHLIRQVLHYVKHAALHAGPPKACVICHAGLEFIIIQAGG